MSKPLLRSFLFLITLLFGIYSWSNEISIHESSFDSYYFTNTAPEVTPISATTLSNTTISIPLTGFDADWDSLTYSIVSLPISGSATVSGSTHIIFIPPTNETGVYTLTYKANDGFLDSNIETITIEVLDGYKSVFSEDQKIQGGSGSSKFGWSIQYNSDGNFFIVGDPDANALKGQAKIYKKVGAVYQQYGTTIDNPYPTARKKFGYSVSINAQGNIVAIGDTFNGNGKVFIYKYNSSTSDWDSIGEITGEFSSDEFGFKVRLNANGNVLAVSARGNYHSDPTFDDGHVRVFTYNGTSWTQLGSDINGDTNSGNQFGKSLAISDNGSRIIVGSMYESGTVGKVEVFDFDGTTWNLITTKNGDSSITYFGDAISLNSDGSIIAVRSSNKEFVKVYKINGNTWQQLGASISTKTANYQTASQNISLNGTGYILAIGSDGFDSEGIVNRGKAEVFKFNGTNWELLASPILGSSSYEMFGFSINLSKDGKSLLVGSYDNYVKTYSLVNKPPVTNSLVTSTDEDVEVSISLTANDTDGDSLTYSIVTPPISGTYTLVNNLFAYKPVLNQTSTVSFSFKVNDGSSDSNIAVVSININSINDDPTATGLPTSLTVLEDNYSNINLSSGTFNDVDLNGGVMYCLLQVSSGTLSSTAITGITIYGNGTEGLQIQGMLNDINTFLDNSSSVKYKGPLNLNGSSVVQLVVYLNDRGNSGSGGGNQVLVKTIPINITQVNDSPTDISLSNNQILEDNSIGELIANISSTDIDAGETFTYSLVSGIGDSDNASFYIEGNLLKASAIFNYNIKNTYNIRLRTSDGGGLTFEKSFVINILVGDSDSDGIIDSLDNCPSVANASQADADSDGIGDACDNAPNTPNPDQKDMDGDGEGDVIDTDDDNDGCPDTSDDFPLDATECTDTDGDGTGDNADTDNDGDGVLDTLDNCVNTPNADQLDTDSDGMGNVCDSDDDNDGFSDTDEATCGTDPLDANSTPTDTDVDGTPDCLDTDDDGDGFSDTDEATCGSDPLDATSMPLDTDTDGTPNCIDPDDDNDSYLDVNDTFPLDASEWLDTDVDGIGNNSDTDDDGDGQLDTDEIACGSDPLLASSISLDTDGDTIPDCVDIDDDNDGVVDTEDAFPLDSSEWTDTDLDGVGNNADTDDDNDGFTDLHELACDSDPLDKFSKPADLDNDLIPDCVDPDRDGDGYLNTEDVFPDNPREWLDSDVDGLGNNVDVDDDNDGCLDTTDVFPFDSNECLDADNDGIGDNADPDDNNDGFEDNKLFVSGALTPGSSGLESTWKVINIERYPNARVTIYNKNAQEVFSALGYKNDWRGTYKNSGDLLPAGSYYYIVDPNNGEKTLTGWLFITY